MIVRRQILTLLVALVLSGCNSVPQPATVTKTPLQAPRTRRVGATKARGRRLS
jgi:starvation-inducible outer membrane lipoprotein